MKTVTKNVSPTRVQRSRLQLNSETMILSERDAEILLEALTSDREPNEAMKKARELQKILIPD